MACAFEVLEDERMKLDRGDDGGALPLAGEGWEEGASASG
jgi:hypothetical protein